MDGPRLVLADLEDLLDELPERLVVGTDADGRMRLGLGTLEKLRERGTEADILLTPEAVCRYSELHPGRADSRSAGLRG